MPAHVLNPFSRVWDIQDVQLLIAGSIPCLHTYQTYHSHWKPSICHRQYVPLQYSKTHAFLFLWFVSHVHQFHGHVHISTASKLLFRKIDKHIDSRDLQMNQGQASHLKQIFKCICDSGIFWWTRPDLMLPRCCKEIGIHSDVNISRSPKKSPVDGFTSKALSYTWGHRNLLHVHWTQRVHACCRTLMPTPTSVAPWEQCWLLEVFDSESCGMFISFPIDFFIAAIYQ